MRFEAWLQEVAEMDDRYAHLTNPEYKDERKDFNRYYEQGLTPEEALRREYEEYG